MLHPALYFMKPIFTNKRDLSDSLTQRFPKLYLCFPCNMVNSLHSYEYLPAYHIFRWGRDCF